VLIYSAALLAALAAVKIAFHDAQPVVDIGGVVGTRFNRDDKIIAQVSRALIFRLRSVPQIGHEAPRILKLGIGFDITLLKNLLDKTRPVTAINTAAEAFKLANGHKPQSNFRTFLSNVIKLLNCLAARQSRSSRTLYIIPRGERFKYRFYLSFFVFSERSSTTNSGKSIVDELDNLICIEWRAPCFDRFFDRTLLRGNGCPFTSKLCE